MAARTPTPRKTECLGALDVVGPGVGLSIDVSLQIWVSEEGGPQIHEVLVLPLVIVFLKSWAQLLEDPLTTHSRPNVLQASLHFASDSTAPKLGTFTQLESDGGGGWGFPVGVGSGAVGVGAGSVGVGAGSVGVGASGHTMVLQSKASAGQSPGVETSSRLTPSEDLYWQEAPVPS